MTIEELWTALRAQRTDAQRRVDATHPHDIYADFDQPDKPALVLFTDEKPGVPPTLKAIAITRGQRPDGRWYLKVVLQDARLLSVFAELCRDIVAATRTQDVTLPPSAIMLSRIDWWQDLLRSQSGGLSNEALRGLLGELFVLEGLILPRLGLEDGVAAWTGPMRTKQDFCIPDGTKIEVKTVHPGAAHVQINGLEQLDAGSDPLKLAVVTLQETGRDADDAVTPSRLVERIRSTLQAAPSARRSFEELLAFAGWNEDQDGDRLSVKSRGIEVYDVDENFPRLIRRNVPSALVDATYMIARAAFGGRHE